MHILATVPRDVQEYMPDDCDHYQQMNRLAIELTDQTNAFDAVRYEPTQRQRRELFGERGQVNSDVRFRSDNQS